MNQERVECAPHPQDLPFLETYLAVFQHMDTVVFFNGQGREARIWQQLTGSSLPSRNIEGAPLIRRLSLCGPPTGAHAVPCPQLPARHRSPARCLQLSFGGTNHGAVIVCLLAAT